MRWQEKLTKAERKHLRETKTRNLTDLKENLLYQKTHDIRCHECLHIAIKIGMELPK